MQQIQETFGIIYCRSCCLTCGTPIARVTGCVYFEVSFQEGCFFFFNISTFQLLDKPWSQVSSLLPPRSCLQFLSRIGFSNPTARRFFIESVANSRSRAFLQVNLCTRKSPHELLRVMHSGGFELTKLTYTTLKYNLIRHRGGPRSPTPLCTVNSYYCSTRVKTVFHREALSHPLSRPRGQNSRKRATGSIIIIIIRIIIQFSLSSYNFHHHHLYQCARAAYDNSACCGININTRRVSYNI